MYSYRWLWYLLPVFLGIIGGAMAWFILRYMVRDTSPVARNCLLLGLLSSIISISLVMISGGWYAEPDPLLDWNR